MLFRLNHFVIICLIILLRFLNSSASDILTNENNGSNGRLLKEKANKK